MLSLLYIYLELQLDGLQCIWRNTAIWARREHFPLAYSTNNLTVYLFTDAQAVYFLHSTTPSVTCLRLSDASVICRVTHFSFQFSLLFSKRQRITLRLLYAIGRPSVVCLSVCLSVCRLSVVCDVGAPYSGG